jgi:deoxyribodipyrimidine photo-lyase
MNFPIELESILERVENIDPIKYGKSRNFIDGDVTYLSPYISRGVISTKQVFESVLKRGFNPYSIEKFIQELAWRDYWQQIWIHKCDEINTDLRHSQEPVNHYKMIKSIDDAATGIRAIDEAIDELYETGYMHNHIRMYLAAIACNVGRAHWYNPAKWMYYHLFDGDWASNTLSWQWVSGSNSNKKYVANQDNINKYTKKVQRGTFMDVPYEELPNMNVPGVLKEITTLDLKTNLPAAAKISIDASKPTLLYNSYNLDPNWKSDLEANRILLLEPSHFEEYPKSDSFINFILGLTKNIDGIQIFVGSFEELQILTGNSQVYFKEHPFSKHYKGIEEPRDWMFTVTGDFRSFFAFWKKCKKELKTRAQQPELFQ